MPSSFRLYHAPWSRASCACIETINTFMEKFVPNYTLTISDLMVEPEVHARRAIRVYPTLVKYDAEGVEVARKTSNFDLVDLVEFMKDD